VQQWTEALGFCQEYGAQSFANTSGALLKQTADSPVVALPKACLMDEYRGRQLPQNQSIASFHSFSIEPLP